MTAALKLDQDVVPKRRQPPVRLAEPLPEEQDRDYVGEMRALVDAETADGPYVAAEVAAKIVARLEERDPELLNGYLAHHAQYLIRQMIVQRDSSRRTHQRTAARRSVFAEAAARHEGGDSEALAGWLGVVHVLDGGVRKRLAEMTAADLMFVADDYDRRAEDNRLAGAFLRALSKKVGRGVVADKFTAEKLDELWRSIAGGQK